MKLKRVEPDSCANCISMQQAQNNHCKFHNKNISKHHLYNIICEDGYEDDGSRFIR